LIDLFVEYSVAISCSAAVDRLLSIGKDIFRSKTATLPNANFKRLKVLATSITLRQWRGRRSPSWRVEA